jgi:hypothetical protein
MRIFVFAYDRYARMSTSLMLERADIDHVVLCHTEQARQQFIDHGTARPERIIATGMPRGLPHNRNAALEMLKHDEWALFLNDDLIECHGVGEQNLFPDRRIPVDRDNQNDFYELYNDVLPMSEMLRRANVLAHQCERIGSRLGGFTPSYNIVNRGPKWRMNVLVDGRAIVVRKGTLRWDTSIETIEDYAWTARNLERYGVTLVDLWTEPRCSRYTLGGYGTREARADGKKRDVLRMLRTYPDTVRRSKQRAEPGAHLAIKRTMSPKHRERLIALLNDGPV